MASMFDTRRSARVLTRADLHRAMLVQTGVLVGAFIAVLRLLA